VSSSAKDIKNVCLRLLARREHSKKELLQKLVVKGFNKILAANVINELAQEGWQDDVRYAENYARSRILKGYGPIRITYELQQNGVDMNTDSVSLNLEAIVQATTAGSWIGLLEEIYNKKFGSGKKPDMNERAFQSRFLFQRGFSRTMISEFFEHLNIL
jgi:regulatory protein